MNLTSTAAYVTSARLRRSAPLFLALLLVGACSDDEVAPAPQPDFSVAVATLDGLPPDGDVPLHCDGKLAVAVGITTSIERVDFILRPFGACSASKRCGFVRVEALDADDQLLQKVDSATNTGLLDLDEAARLALTQIRVSLISGVDRELILNKDKTEVSAVVSPSFIQPSGCAPEDGGGGQGGGGGQAGETAVGGAGGAGTGGAAGAENVPDPLGGAGAGGEPSDVGGAGAGGAGGAP